MFFTSERGDGQNLKRTDGKKTFDPGSSSKSRKRKRLFALIGLGALLCLGLLALALPRQKQPALSSDSAFVPVSAGQASPRPFVSRAVSEAHAANSDVVGWLTLEGCGIDEPVLQSFDNDYYLRRNEAGEEDVWGCYFLDYINRNDGTALPDKVSIIYGHSVGDTAEGERFCALKRYRTADFALQNPTFGFSLLYEEDCWQIFSACDIPISIDYIDPNPSREKYQQTLDYMLEHSYVDFGVEVGPSDHILILSTCTSDESVRFVVAAKPVQP